MGALAETCDGLGIPYRQFGFDSAMSEVVLETDPPLYDEVFDWPGTKGG